MRISVIVPLYNKLRYIERCLTAICAQTYGDFEVIVVNDGSTDGGEALVRDWPDPRVRLISQSNAGPGAARNRGVHEAQGEIIAMLDADDGWDRDYLKESIRQLDQWGGEVACLTWGMQEYPANRSTEGRWARIGIPNGRFRVTPQTDPLLLAGIVSNMLPSSTVIRKSAFERWGGFYAKNRCLFAEDAHLWLKVLLHHEVAFDSRPLVDRHCDASELSMNLANVRPVEPFLLDPADLTMTCPPELASLLRKFLAIRACKTASVYGYHGLHARARELMRGFVSAADWRAPFFWIALLSCTPAGKWLGSFARIAGLNLRESNA